MKLLRAPYSPLSMGTPQAPRQNTLKPPPPDCLVCGDRSPPLCSLAQMPPPEGGRPEGSDPVCSGRHHPGEAAYLGTLVSGFPRAACVPWVAVEAL